MSKAQCALCKDIIESTYRHHFVSCKCGEIFLDGGDEYLRYGASDPRNVLFIEEKADTGIRNGFMHVPAIPRRTSNG